jgi:endoglucanase
VIKAYHVKVIAAIRANDPNNVIVAGTPDWSSDVVAAAQDPINGTNIAYTFHYYAGLIKITGFL